MRGDSGCDGTNWIQTRNPIIHARDQEGLRCTNVHVPASCSNADFALAVDGSRMIFRQELRRLDALILIDIQVGFDDPAWGERNNLHAEEHARTLLARWRHMSRPVVHVKHVSTTSGSPLSGAGTEFKAQVVPISGETIFKKSVNSAFIGTGLHEYLKEIGATDLTICGFTTPHCVSTTTRMAANMGYNVRLVADACAAFTSNADVSFDTGPALTADEIHRSALAHLHGEFAHVCQIAEVLIDA